MENTISKVELSKVIWIPSHYRKLGFEAHSITRHTLKVWDNLHKREKWEYNSPLIPLRDTEFFAPGMENLSGRWILQGGAQLKDVMQLGKICSFQDLKSRSDLLTLNRWRYSQLKNFIETLPQPIRMTDNLKPFEKLCVGQDGKKGISKIYRILVDLKGTDIPAYIKKWESELKSKLKEDEVTTLLKRVHSTSVNYKMSELNYKCLSRWYITPDRVSKYQNEISQLCWRGCMELGTTAHVWWHCTRIREFWDDIRKITGEITQIVVPDDPWACLFHGFRMSTESYLRTLVPQMLNAAKSLLVSHWQEKQGPTIQEWYDKINETQNLEYLGCTEEAELEEFEEKWKKWQKFKSSPRVLEVLRIE